MKNKQIAYGILIAGIVYYMYSQGAFQILKTKLMIIMALFGIGVAYLINKYIK